MSETKRTLSRIVLAVVAAVTVALGAAQAGDDQDRHALGFQGDELRVTGSGDERVFEVRGRTFTWNDLDASDRARLQAIEERLEAAERELRLSEGDLDAWAGRMEAVAREMETVVRSLEDVEVDFEIDGEKATLRDLERLSAKLAAATRGMEERMREHELALAAVEAEQPRFSEEAIREIERSARAYEQALLEIAERL